MGRSFRQLLIYCKLGRLLDQDTNEVRVGGRSGELEKGRGLRAK